MNIIEMGIRMQKLSLFQSTLRGQDWNMVQDMKTFSKPSYDCREEGEYDFINRAYSKNKVIGNQGIIPWRIKGDS